MRCWEQLLRARSGLGEGCAVYLKGGSSPGGALRMKHRRLQEEAAAAHIWAQCSVRAVIIDVACFLLSPAHTTHLRGPGTERAWGSVNHKAAALVTVAAAVYKVREQEAN
jgi:hypothetical protein